MAAAALWAGCDDFEKSDDAAKQGNPKFIHPWNTKKFFDEKNNGNLLEKKKKKRLDSLRNIGELIDSGVTTLYGVYEANPRAVAIASVKTQTKSKGLVDFPVREKISVVEKSSLDKESVFKVLVSFTPGLRHIYSIRYLMKNPDKHFEGEIVFKLIIVADGTVKDIQIVSSRDFQSIIFDFPGFKALGDIIPTFKLQYKKLRNRKLITLNINISRTYR